jgi:hypothetical protein
VQELLTNLSLFLSGLRNTAEQLASAQCWKRIWGENLDSVSAAGSGLSGSLWPRSKVDGLSGRAITGKDGAASALTGASQARSVRSNRRFEVHKGDTPPRRKGAAHPVYPVSTSSSLIVLNVHALFFPFAISSRLVFEV